MKRKSVHILIPYVFHLLLIAIGFLDIPDRFDIMTVILLAGTLLYIVYWSIVNRKRFYSWMFFLHFLVGATLQVVLNLTQVITPDGGFFTGLGQLFYAFYVIGAELLVGITNLVLWLLDRHRRKKQAASAAQPES